DHPFLPSFPTRRSSDLVGVNLDVFHYYPGPSKFEDFAHLRAERLAHVQIADVSGVARELATDSDRILPGDGDFQLAPILDVLRRSEEHTSELQSRFDLV